MAHCLWFTVMQVQKIFCISSITFNFPNNDTLTAQCITTRLPNPSLNVILDPYIDKYTFPLLPFLFSIWFCI